MRDKTLGRRDQLAFRRYYSSGETLLKLNIELIKMISDYALSQINPQVTKEAIDVINYITTIRAAEEVLKYVICYEDMNEELYNFLIKSITTVYN